MSTPAASDDADSPAATDGESHPNASQDVIAVDENDEPSELVNRLDAHTGDGVRHRAFTALLFDEAGNLLLAQRSPEKRLWDTCWDGTVASHPREGETQVEATANASKRNSASRPTSTATFEPPTASSTNATTSRRVSSGRFVRC